MPVAQPKTVVIHAHGMVAAISNVIVQMLSKKLDFKNVTAVQFIPNGRIRVTFSSVEYQNVILGKKFIWIDDLHQLQVTESDIPVTSVYVHYLPVEAGDVGIRLAFAPFGKILDISQQHFSGFKKVGTGTRIVRMSLEHHIPFQCNIQGYPCRVWYAGQPIKCTICKGAHKAADCPDKNKCRRCRQPGHFAKDCKNAWGTFPQVNRAAPAGPQPAGAGVVNPPTPDPSVPDPPSPDPQAPSVVADSAADPAHVPPPLMSLDVSPPSSSESSEAMEDGSQDPVTSQVSLFSEPEASFGEFSQGTSPPVPSPSPSISEFTDTSDASQSILKNCPIVSSGPVVEQIVIDNVSSISNSVSNGSLSGPKVAHKSNVECPKVASNNGSKKPNDSKQSSGEKEPEPTLLKLSQSGRPGQFDFLSPSGVVADSDSSSSESTFKPPVPPKPCRTVSRSLVRGRSHSLFIPSSPGAHRGIPQVMSDRPSRRS